MWSASTRRSQIRCYRAGAQLPGCTMMGAVASGIGTGCGTLVGEGDRAAGAEGAVVAEVVRICPGRR